MSFFSASARDIGVSGPLLSCRFPVGLRGVVESIPLREAARRGNLEPSSPSADPFPFAAPDAPAERLIPLLRVQGAAGMKSRRGSSRAAQIDARRVQHTAVIHMAQ